MAKIQIITDSMTDIPKELAEEYGIRVIPLTILFGDQAYQDGIDLTPEAFYAKLAASDELPRTSQVTPAAFQQAFEEALNQNLQVLCINASSKASGTHQSALIAQREIGSDQIRVVDTLGLCMGAGLTVLETARQIEKGAGLTEAAAFAVEYAKGVESLFTVDTVKYLQKGGRINPGKALIANVLNIKPILTVRDGLVDPLDKVRGSRRVMEKMIEIAGRQEADFSDKTVAIAHAHVADRALRFRDQVEEVLRPKEIIIADIGCTIGTHAGPGTLSLFYHRQVNH